MANTSQRIQFQQFRDENLVTNYPFSSAASLSNGVQVILQGVLVDAALYPIGGAVGPYISQVVVAHETVTLMLSDENNGVNATAVFPVVNPPGSFAFTDGYGRPAGIVVCNPLLLGMFSTWGAGTYNFTVAQTEFSATVYAPTPAVGVQGILLDDGTLLTGDVWIVGDDGVALTASQQTAPALACGGMPQLFEVIRVDVVGDPLFVRRLCSANNFQTPRFLSTITFKDQAGTRVQLGPDAQGNINLTVNNAKATDTVLRVTPTPAGTKIEVVGSSLQNVLGV